MLHFQSNPSKVSHERFEVVLFFCHNNAFHFSNSSLYTFLPSVMVLMTLAELNFQIYILTNGLPSMDGSQKAHKPIKMGFHFLA